MQNIKKYFITLALLLTAVGGAWAQSTEPTEWELTSQDGKVWTLAKMPAGNVELQVAYFPGMLTLAQAEGGSIEVVGLGEPIVAELTDIDGWKNDPTLLSAADLPGFVAISEDIAKTWNHTPASFLAEPLYYGFEGDDVERIMFEDGAVFTRKGTTTRDACYQTVKIVKSHIYYTTGVKMHDGFDTDGTNYYVEPKTQFQVKAVPAEGYHLVKLMAGETDITDKVDADGIATITMPEGDADLTLTATFSDQYELTFDDVNFKTNQNITVKVGDADKTLDQDGKLSVKAGQTVTLTAKQGYKFRKVEVKKGGAAAAKTITIGDMELTYADGDTWETIVSKNSDKIKTLAGGYIVQVAQPEPNKYRYIKVVLSNKVNPSDIIDPSKNYEWGTIEVYS